VYVDHPALFTHFKHQGVGGDEDDVLASLLLFRGIYYVVPFIAAMALLGGVEAVRRWRSLREAISARSDD